MGKRYLRMLFFLGYDGEEGLPVRGSSNNNSGATEDYIRTEAQNQANKIPIVGGLISRMGSEIEVVVMIVKYSSQAMLNVPYNLIKK
ncbi:hypothetical protein OVA29_21710 [Exiguobacterium sp. SL14]|nr:hypothetical protein [Exiguobacterium sp. SL14]